MRLESDIYSGRTTSTPRSSSECTSFLLEARCLFSSLVDNQLRNRLVSEKKGKIYQNLSGGSDVRTMRKGNLYKFVVCVLPYGTFKVVLCMKKHNTYI